MTLAHVALPNPQLHVGRYHVFLEEHGERLDLRVRMDASG